jgi:hypothetical protein
MKPELNTDAINEAGRYSTAIMLLILTARESHCVSFVNSFKASLCFADAAISCDRTIPLFRSALLLLQSISSLRYLVISSILEDLAYQDAIIVYTLVLVVDCTYHMICNV